MQCGFDLSLFARGRACSLFSWSFLVAFIMSKRAKWNGYKEKMAKKRCGKKDEAGPSGLGANSLTVQRLTSTVEGKYQKYSRMGPLTLVPMEKEATLENIKEACRKHFNTNMECDVLAGERGPSYQDASQIQNWKVIHIRFLDNMALEAEEIILEESPPIEQPCDRKSPKSSMMSSLKPTSKSSLKPTVAASVSLSRMLDIGKLITPEVEIVAVNLEEFSVAEMAWLEPKEATISVKIESFASGGFRDAFMAKSINGLPSGQYVLKKYKKTEIEGIKKLFGTILKHTRKVVQMSALARNFAQNMEEEVSVFEFGQTFTYAKVYYASMNGEPVTIEPYIQGRFEKYINNTGNISEDDSEVVLKAETFVHYTHERSDGQLIVTDIQGVKYSLCDPEIATSTLLTEEGNAILFCCGNLSATAIKNFILGHKCNKYCHLLKLPELKSQESKKPNK